MIPINNCFTIMINSSSSGRFDGDDKYPASFDSEYENPSFKKPTNPSTLPNSGAQVLNNDARTRYYKTQLCRRFRQGNCTLGSDCSFAHCDGELRRQEFGDGDTKICRMFYRGQQCSYGNTCRFLHTRPSSVNSRDTATVEVIPSGHGKRKYDELEFKSGSNESSDDKVNPKREPVKPKLCTMWNTEGRCLYGHMCRFAHGQAELGKSDGCSTAECRVVRTSAPTTNVSGGVAAGTLLKKLKESFAWNNKFSRNELHRISRIYGDWI